MLFRTPDLPNINKFDHLENTFENYGKLLNRFGLCEGPNQSASPTCFVNSGVHNGGILETSANAKSENVKSIIPNLKS